MYRRLTAAVVAGIALLVGASGLAADAPLAGAKLVLKQGPGGAKAVLVLRDASVIVPAPGEPDDPAQHTGLLLTLVSAAEPASPATLFVPSGLGKPGWSVRPGAPPRYVYRNSDAPSAPSPVRRVRLDAKGIKVVARDTGLPLATPQGAVAAIVEMGETRLCAVFGGEAVRRDEAGLFVARKVPAPDTVTCDVDALLGIPCEASETCSGFCGGGAQCGGEFNLGCECVSPDQPCGNTAPVCNGECPAGEACANIGGVPYPSCACLPAGSTGCGTVDPVCGDGDCPAGLECNLTTFTCCGGVTISGCGCTTGPPDPGCEGCPESWQCFILPPGGDELCIPPFCDGGSGSPVCDGSCAGGMTCTSLVGQCFCVEHCNDGAPYPTCGGTCSDPTAACLPDPDGTGLCICGPA